MSAGNLRPHIFATLALALPLTGSHLARQAIGVTDTVMIGWYGVEPLAATVLATSFFFLLFMLGSGYGIAVMGVIASALARDDKTEVRRATRMALWLSSAHAIVVLPLMWWSGRILLALGQTPEVAAYAQEYLRIMCWAMGPVLWGMTLNSFLAAVGRAHIVLWVTVGGIPINMALNYALIFGYYGAPELGVAGSALASLTVNVAQMIALVICAARLPEARPFDLFRRFWRPDWEALRSIFRLGFPVGLTLVAETGMFAGTNVMMGWFGANFLAAHGIAVQMVSIAFMFHLGLANAVTIRLGTAFGVHDRAGMTQSGLAGTLLSVVFAAIAITIFLTSSEYLAGLYLAADNPEAPVIAGLVGMLMVYAAIFQLADGMQVIALGMLRGVHDTRGPMVLAVISYWLIGLPLGGLLGITAGLGPAGLWIGLCTGLATAAASLMLRFWRGHARGWTPIAQTG